MQKRKPIMINLVASLIMCVVTFIIGFSISSFALLDSRLESAQEKNAELNAIIDEKDGEIKSLNEALEQKSKENVVLGEKIADQATTIEDLKSTVSSLEDDVNTISEVALGGNNVTGTVVTTFAALSTTQQLVFFIVLLVILILIVSITCAVISAFSSPKKASLPEKVVKKRSEPVEEVIEDEDMVEEEIEEESEEVEPEVDEKVEEPEAFIPKPVQEALNLLYRNNLEDSISALGGFKFGVTNFDEILSDKAKGKSFGNTENGDFVAFLSSENGVKKIFIIPRHLTLSDSTVALRGVTDLFNITDGAQIVTGGTVRIKSVKAPAVFICGENGWSIESKGLILSLSN